MTSFDSVESNKYAGKLNRLALQRSLVATCVRALANLRQGIVPAALNGRGAWLASFFGVGALQLTLLYPLHRTTDLPQWDEANYMGQGDAFLHGGNLGPFSGSPVYHLLYSLFIRAVGRVDSIFCPHYLVITAVSLLLFCFLSAHLRSRLLATLLTMIWVVANTNVFAGVLVNHVALGLFLLALVCLESHQLIALLFLCLCLLTRLEYLLIFIPVAIYIVVRNLQIGRFRASGILNAHEIKNRITWRNAAGSLLLVLIIYIVLHLGDTNAGGRRTWFAFEQHYALRAVQNGRFKLDPFVDYNIVIQKDFPGAASFSQAFAVNPRFFVRHIASNVPRLVKSIFASVAGPYTVSVAGPYRAAVPLTVMMGVLVGFCISLLSLALQVPGFLKGLAGAVREQKMLLAVTILSLTSLIPALLVYPQSRYTLAMVPFVLVWLGLVCQQAFNVVDSPGFERRVLMAMVILFVFFIAISPRPFRVEGTGRPIFAEISALDRLWPDQRLKLMGVGSVWIADYLGTERAVPIEPFATVFGEPMQPGSGDMRVLLKRYDPDVVLVNKELTDSPNFDTNTRSALDSGAWRRCTIGLDSFYFKVGRVNASLQCSSE